MGKHEKGQGAGKPAKLRMSNRKFRVLVIIPLVIIALVAVISTVASSLLSSTLDTYVGKGATYIETPVNETGWDSSYYATAVEATEGQE